ncbi:MAG TPA: carboxylesterase/lipase family protein [Kofleriaceae bacterium]
MDTRTVNRAFLLALCGCLAACGTDAPPDPTRVKLADGEVHGSVKGTSLQFLGIPYAKPPVGDLRWKAPQKPDPWSNVRDATQFGKRCAQLMDPTLQNAASNDEDCLYLNVWTWSPPPKNPLPVMIWIHGGGNVNGSASEPVPFLNTGVFYSGELLAGGHSVVVVSLNYRLGIFGFFGHPDLWAEGSSGNQGLLDQQMAFQWVHDNIAKFGGDPGNVTIFGESAGSFDVCMHMAAPSNTGLFHRAISESGGCTTVQRTKAQAEAAATSFATGAGCTGAGALACLRGKPAATLMASPDVAAGTGFGPEVDTQFLPDQPRTLYDMGKIAKVPYLLGSNTDEGTLFLPATKPATDPDYMAALTAMFGASASAVANVYMPGNFPSGALNSQTAALARVIGDSRLVCTTFDTAVRTSHAGASVYMYNFDVPVPALVSTTLGATHGSELTSVFGTSPTFATDPAAKAVSDLMQRYWTNFARTGNPNAGADLSWPAFSESANVRINFALQQPTIVNDFRATECAFWRMGYALQFPM